MLTHTYPYFTKHFHLSQACWGQSNTTLKKAKLFSETAGVCPACFRFLIMHCSRHATHVIGPGATATSKGFASYCGPETSDKRSVRENLGGFFTPHKETKTWTERKTALATLFQPGAHSHAGSTAFGVTARSL